MKVEVAFQENKNTSPALRAILMQMWRVRKNIVDIPIYFFKFYRELWTYDYAYLSYKNT